MKIIEWLSDKIDEEIGDATCYAKKAIEEKAERPALADVLYNLSLEEMKHMSWLHNEVVRLIEEYRKTKGEPPAEMLFLYNYLHKKSIDKASEAKSYQALYKETKA